MKTFTFLIAVLLTFICKGQGIVADPAISQVGVENLNSTALNPFSIPLDNAIEIKVPFYNYNTLNALPQGSCKIKIGLGSKMLLDPQFDFAALPSSAYFTWTYEIVSGQVQVTGDLKTDLPPNFSDSVIIKVIGNIQGNSTITTNFLVTNHNTQVVLSDQNPTNNNSFLAYTIVAAGPLPVTFTRVSAINKDCFINVEFFTETEINVSRYEIEASKDGTYFVKVGETRANNDPSYQSNFAITETLKSSNLFIRVKSIDKDGKYQYSSTITVKGFCSENNRWAVGVYPNPAKSISTITLTSKQEQFNGKYHITLSDMTGRSLVAKDVTLINIGQYLLDVGNIAAGQYIIKIASKEKKNETATIKWEKY